ncbi:hypothetical protein [Thaumasiovibrio sp. DFM-14]|uniref:hypothetical protein n=1 Tax=Thaumasiovibrio sp. DFM-14 TaxID=3384792 RepID=UPI0039A1519B
MLFKRIFQLVFILLIAACNSSTSDEPPHRPPGRDSAIISGVVYDAAVSQAIVKVYEYQNGRVGTLLGSDYTNPKGEYSIPITSGNMPLYIESTGGVYLDPYTNEEVYKGPNGQLRLRTYINFVEGQDTHAMITPLTNAVAGYVEYHSGPSGRLTAAVAIAEGYSEFNQAYGLDILATEPFDLKHDGVSSVTLDEHRYGAILTAYSSFAFDNIASGETEGYTDGSQVYTSYNLADIQYRDIRSNGIMDGLEVLGNPPVLRPISYGLVVVNADLYTNHIAQHMLRVVNDSTINRTGTDPADYYHMAERINAASGGIFPIRDTDKPINETPPYVSRKGNEILSGTGRLTLEVSDFIGVHGVTVSIEREVDYTGNWQTVVATCSLLNSDCRALDANFEQGIRYLDYRLDINTLKLDEEAENVLSARAVVIAEDVLGNITDKVYIPFEWDNNHPVINIDELLSPPSYNPHNPNVDDYVLAGTVTETKSPLTSLVYSINNGEFENLEYRPTMTPNVYSFNQYIHRSHFEGLTTFTLRATDSNGNQDEVRHFVYSDVTPPERVIHFPINEMQFILNDNIDPVTQMYTADTFSDMSRAIYLSIKHGYATHGLRTMLPNIDFEDMTREELEAEYIPYLRVEVRDPLGGGGSVGSSAENLLLTVRWESGPNLDAPVYSRTITSRDTVDGSRAIPHEKMPQPDGNGHIPSMTYFVPFTSDIFGPSFKNVGPEHQQRLTLMVTDESGNESQLFTTTFRTTFNLPYIEVNTPFINAKVNFYRFTENGTTADINQCITKQVPLVSSGGDARDLARCGIFSQHTNQVIKITLDSNNNQAHYYQWSKDSRANAKLDPANLNEDHAFSAYVFVDEYGKQIYMTELTVYQAGFFAYLWNKDKSDPRVTLDAVDRIFQSETDFFGFNPTRTRYATNEDLDEYVDITEEFQHRFIVEALGEMAEYPTSNSVDLAKLFFEDFSSDGKPNGRGWNNRRLSYGREDITSDWYRSKLAEHYIKFLTRNYGDSILSQDIYFFANRMASINPVLDGNELFDSAGGPIDQDPPSVTISVDALSANSAALYQGGYWYLRGLIDRVLIELEDPSGIKDSDGEAPAFDLVWVNTDAEPQNANIHPDAEQTGTYYHAYQFGFDTLSPSYPNIARLELDVSASDIYDNNYGFSTDTYHVPFIIDNDPPKYEYFPPPGVDDPQQDYISFASSRFLDFSAQDTVGENFSERTVIIKQGRTELEFGTDDMQGSRLVLCKAGDCIDEYAHEIGNGTWDILVLGEDYLGNKTDLLDATRDAFTLKVDSNAPVIDPVGTYILGGNQRWRVANVIDYGVGDFSDPGPISITMRGHNLPAHPLTHCESDDCNDVTAYLIGHNANTEVRLVADRLENGQEYIFEITAEDTAKPFPNLNTGEFTFTVDSEAPKVSLGTPWVTDYVDHLGTNNIVGKRFYVNIAEITDASRVTSVSVWQQGQELPLLPPHTPESLVNLKLFLDEDATNQIKEDADGWVTLSVEAEDEHGFSSNQNFRIIFDNQPPVIGLMGFDEENWYAREYAFNLTVTDLDEHSVQADSLKYRDFPVGGVPGNWLNVNEDRIIKINRGETFSLEIAAEDIRGNATTSNFTIQVDDIYPTVELSLLVGGRPLERGETLIEHVSERVVAVVNASDDQSGINRVLGTIAYAGQQGQALNFERVGEGRWEAELSSFVQTDGDYQINVEATNRTLVNPGDDAMKQTDAWSLGVMRGGYQVLITKPENFSSHISGREMAVEFGYEDTNVTGNPRSIECWIRERSEWDGNNPPGNTLSPYDYVSSPQGNPQCLFASFTQDYNEPVLITRTVGGNGAEVVQGMSFRGIDITPPEIIDREGYALNNTHSVVTTGNEKMIYLFFEVKDDMAGIPDEVVNNIVLINHAQERIALDNATGSTSNRHLTFKGTYDEIINARTSEQSVRLSGIEDAVGNQQLTQNTIKLLPPTSAPTIRHVDHANGDYISSKTLEFVFEYELGLDSLLYDLKVDITYYDGSKDTYTFIDHIEMFTRLDSENCSTLDVCYRFKADLGGTQGNLYVGVEVLDFWNKQASSSVRLIFDDTPPVIGEVSGAMISEYQPPGGGEPVPAGGFQFDISDAQSGLYEVAYNLIGSNHSQTKRVDENDANLTVFDIPYSVLNQIRGNELTLTVMAIDRAGNESIDVEERTIFGIDKPDVSFDVSGVEYRNGIIEFTSESGPYSFTIDAPTAEGAMVTAASYELAFVPRNGEPEQAPSTVTGPIGNGSVTRQLHFTDANQGEYKLKVTVFDNIGRDITDFVYANTNFDADGIDIILDWQDPVITDIHFEQTGEQSGDLYNVVVRASVYDANLRDVTIDLNPKLLTRNEGASAATMSFNLPSTDAKSFNVPVGQYIATLTATDKVGHKSTETVDVEVFGVPTLDITNVKPNPLLSWSNLLRYSSTANTAFSLGYEVKNAQGVIVKEALLGDINNGNGGTISDTLSPDFNALSNAEYTVSLLACLKGDLSGICSVWSETFTYVEPQIKLTSHSSGNTINAQEAAAPVFSGTASHLDNRLVNMLISGQGSNNISAQATITNGQWQILPGSLQGFNNNANLTIRVTVDVEDGLTLSDEVVVTLVKQGVEITVDDVPDVNIDMAKQLQVRGTVSRHQDVLDNKVWLSSTQVEWITGTASVNTNNNTWEATLDDFSEQGYVGEIDLVATVTDSRGNTVSVNTLMNVGLVPPSVTIEPVMGGGLVNADAASQLVISGSSSANDDIIEVIIVGANNNNPLPLESQTGSRWQTQPYNLLSDGLDDGTIPFSVEVIDRYGNHVLAHSSFDLQATLPSISINEIGENGIINSDAANKFVIFGTRDKRDYAVTVVLQQGDKEFALNVRDDKSNWKTADTNLVSQTDLADGEVRALATIIDTIGNKNSAERTFHLQVDAQPLSIFDIDNENKINANMVGEVTIGGTIENRPQSLRVTVTDENSRTVSADSFTYQNQQWNTTLDLSSLSDGNLDLAVSYIDVFANSGSAEFDRPLSLKSTIPEVAFSLFDSEGNEINTTSGMTKKQLSDGVKVAGISRYALDEQVHLQWLYSHLMGSSSDEMLIDITDEAGDWQYLLSHSSFFSGTLSITVNLTDEYGNLAEQVELQYDVN